MKVSRDSKQLKKLVEDALAIRLEKQAETLAREQKALKKARIEALRPIRAVHTHEVLSFLTTKDFPLLKNVVKIRQVKYGNHNNGNSSIDPDNDKIAFELTFDVAEVHPLVQTLRLATESKVLSDTIAKEDLEEWLELDTKINDEQWAEFLEHFRKASCHPDPDHACNVMREILEKSEKEVCFWNASAADVYLSLLCVMICSCFLRNSCSVC